MIRSCRFRIGDTVVYKPELPSKLIKQYLKYLYCKINKRAKVVGIYPHDRQIVVRFHKDRKNYTMGEINFKLIKAVPRHPLTNIFADKK